MADVSQAARIRPGHCSRRIFLGVAAAPAWAPMIGSGSRATRRPPRIAPPRIKASRAPTQIGRESSTRCQVQASSASPAGSTSRAGWRPHEIGAADDTCRWSSDDDAASWLLGHSDVRSALRRCRGRRASVRSVGPPVRLASAPSCRRAFRWAWGPVSPVVETTRASTGASRRSRVGRGTGLGDDHRRRGDRLGLCDGWSRRLGRRWRRLGSSGSRRRLLSGRWRRGRRGGRRGWGGRRRGCRGRLGGTPRRKQAEWVDVGVLADPNAEMDVRNRMLSVARWPGICDRVSLGDDCSLPDAQRSEVCEGCLVSVGGDDRHREAVRRHLPGERHLAGRGRLYRRRLAYRDVDSAMLTRGVLVSTDRVAAKHVAVGGPHPRPRGRSGAERPDDGEGSADHPSRCPVREHGATVASVVRDGNAIDCLVTESPGTERFGTCRSGEPPLPPQPVATRPRRRDPRPPHGRHRPPVPMRTSWSARVPG